MVDQKQYHSFYELGLHDRSSYCDQRLVREYDASFRYGPYITLEFEVGEILEKLFVEQFFASQVFDIFVCELKIFQILYNLFQPREDRITAAIRDLSEKHIEIRYVVSHSRTVISIGHRDLIKVSEHGQVKFFNHFYILHVKSDTLSLLF